MTKTKTLRFSGQYAEMSGRPMSCRYKQLGWIKSFFASLLNRLQIEINDPL